MAGPAYQTMVGNVGGIGFGGASRLTLNQIFVLAMVLALLPVAVTAIILSNAARQYAEQLISRRLSASAMTTAYSQRATFALAKRMLVSYARNPAVRRGGIECGAALRRGLTIKTGLMNFARVSPDGMVKCSALPFDKGMSLAGEPYWRDAKSTGRYTLSVLTIGLISRRPVFLAVMPLRGADGSFDGTVSAAIDASWLETALAKEKLSKEAMVWIVDRQGQPLLSSGRADIPVIDLAASVNGLATLRLPDGTEWIYARHPLYRDQLSVVYAEPKAPLFAPVWEHFGLSLLLPVLALALTIIALVSSMHLFLGRWMTRLKEYTARLASGDYHDDRKTFSDAPREIAGLADDLSSMATVIAAREKENRAMMREVNHRVKNNLQMIVSLLELEASQVSHTGSRHTLDQTRMRVSAIAHIHRLLYEFDGGSEGGLVDMDRLIIDLCEQICASFFRAEFTVHCHSDAGTVPLDTAMPLTLLIVEAISEIYRLMTDAQIAGDVAVRLERRQEHALLTIANDALVIPEVQADTIARHLMLGYAAQVHGQLTIKATSLGGMMVLRFPSAMLEMR